VVLRVTLAAFVLASITIARRSPVAAEHPACTVQRVIDGDTFVCGGGERVRLLQIDTPELDACGGTWARAALGFFLRPGTSVRLEYDAVTEDRFGRHLAAPIVRGTDGADYNISIVMVYTGLARAAYYGDNAALLEWARAAEAWARAAGWNMWAPGGPFNGGLLCG
jgi:endonuclease YncB( thermonuclease family)